MLKRFAPILALVALCWLVFFANNLLFGGHLNQYGIVPRRFASLPTILWAPFLHASFRHLLANTLPLLILGGIICARNKSEFVEITVVGVLVGGALTWLFARNGSHIGASGLIFCFFGYLASMAWFRRTVGTLLLSLICIVAYGGILRGLFPTSTAISWEGHAAGLATGILLAWASSKLNPPHKEPESKSAELTLPLEK